MNIKIDEDYFERMIWRFPEFFDKYYPGMNAKALVELYEENKKKPQSLLSSSEKKTIREIMKW